MRVTGASPITFVLLGLTVVTLHAGANENLSFSPSRGITADVAVNGKEVTVELKKGRDVVIQKILIETEKNLKLSVDDYNFDGHSDFSILRLDDGMGTYTIYQIYIYFARENKFKMLSPNCGDEFINVVLSKKKRLLKNYYIDNNTFRACTMKY